MCRQAGDASIFLVVIILHHYMGPPIFCDASIFPVVIILSQPSHSAMGCCESRTSVQRQEELLSQQGAKPTAPPAIPLSSLETGLVRAGNGVAGTCHIGHELEVLRATIHICTYFQEQFSARLAAVDAKLRRAPSDPRLEREVAESRVVEQYLIAYIQNMEPRLTRAERIGVG
jgi:hypothetical protein